MSKTRRVWALALMATPVAVMLGGTAGATGLNFRSDSHCRVQDGAIVTTVEVTNPTPWPFRVDTGTSGLPGLIQPHETTRVDFVATPGTTVWVDMTGAFVGHSGDAFYGTPGTTEDLAWSDGQGFTVPALTCEEPTTTTTGPTTTTTAPVATTPSSVPPSTVSDITRDTTPVQLVPNDTVPVTAPADDNVALAVDTEEPAAAPGDALAFTGSGTAQAAAVGVALLTLGGAMVFVTRRKEA